MKLNWQNLRPWNGSQQNAFETLCCQLAKYEKVPSGSIFERKGTPDAGVECYWTLPNGDEICWQAKFFTDIPKETQLAEIDKSVKTALEKHPRMIKYYICLPIDKPDARIINQKSFYNKWKDREAKWTTWANQNNRKVKFEFWGEDHTIEMLSKEEHRGRYQFWFNKDFFTHGWYKEKLTEAISCAGPRYTPEINVELPISSVFNGFAHNTFFYSRIIQLFAEIKINFNNINNNETIDEYSIKYILLSNLIDTLIASRDTFGKLFIEYFDFSTLIDDVKKAVSVVWNIIEFLEKQDYTPEEKSKHPYEKKYSYSISKLYKLNSCLGELSDFLETDEVAAFNAKTLLITGKAGTGKTHLLCDVCSNNIKAELPSLILFGEKFINGEPYTQILRQLDVSFQTFGDFLETLQVSAESYNSFVTIFIDALNEGEGKHIWKTYLNEFILKVKKYNRIKLVFSVRSTYREIVIPDGIPDIDMLEIFHNGFWGNLINAANTFFDYYKIQRPSIPLLNSEFNNPLFLKTFCRAIVNGGYKSIPSGIRGITSIFEFYIDSLDKKLSTKLEYDYKEHLVKKAIFSLSGALVENLVKFLNYEDAKMIVNIQLPNKSFEDSLFRHLLSEGLISEENYYVGNNKYEEGIRLSYEKFTDHYKARYLIEKYFDEANSKNSFNQTTKLGQVFLDEKSCSMNRGIIESLTIQIPEKTQKELFEFVPQCSGFRPMIESFIESFIWRDTNSFNKSTIVYINKYVTQYEPYNTYFLNTLLTIANNPLHPYNANFLHGNLILKRMPDRDVWWSTFLFRQWEGDTAVDRIIDWSWNIEDASEYDEESIYLTAKTICWFFSSSQRFLRDRSTKALVNLLTPKLWLFPKLMDEFRNVDDPYIIERLLCACYGCMIRSKDLEQIAIIAQYVYEWIFKDGCPIPHILIRDYARGIIDHTLRNGLELKIDITKIEPPYKSKWPNRIPSKNYIERKYYIQNSNKDNDYAQNSIVFSVMRGGDFDRYIIGTNSNNSSWSNRRTDKTCKPNPKQRYEDFIANLTPLEKKAWKLFEDAVNSQDVTIVINDINWQDNKKRKRNPLSKESHKIKLLLLKTLSKEKSELCEKFIIPFRLSQSFNSEPDSFDLRIAQRFILNRVFQLGWTKERFGNFDSHAPSRYSYGRGESKPERIGKKYQWIAYHEFLARVSDNFEFRKDSWSHEERFEGAWQDFIRNIDPSCLIQNTKQKRINGSNHTWWTPINYNNWNSSAEDKIWLTNTKDIPDFKNLIEVTNPIDKSKWFVLETYFSIEQPTPIDEDKFKIPRREIYFLLKSYFIHKKDSKKNWIWAKKQNWYGRWMPESHEQTRIFLGEFYNSKAYDFFNIPYYHHDSWTKPERKNSCEVYVTSDQYLQEKGYDCSINNSILMHLPCELIIKEMELVWTGYPSHYSNQNNNLLVFDPSINESGPSALLIKKDFFLEFIKNKDYDVFWTVAGEKQILGGMSSYEDFQGRLLINGAYRISNNKISGDLHTEYESPNH